MKSLNFFKIVRKTLSGLFRILVYSIRLGARIIPQIFQRLGEAINKRLKFSITFKAATTYGLLFTRVFIGLSIVLTVAFGAFLFSQSKESLNSYAAIVDQWLQSDAGGYEAQLQQLAQVSGIEIHLLDRQQIVRYATDSETGIPAAVLQNPNEASFVSNKLYVTREVASLPDIQFIVVAQNISKQIVYLVALVTGLGFIFMMTLLYTVLKGSKTLRRMLQPIDDMIKTIRSITASDSHTRLNVTGSHDELKDLAVTFNEMLDRLHSSYAQQNQFVADASHELRTPIAVIQGYANLLQRWGKEDKAVLEEAVTAIGNEALNMQSLVERLLFLARADQETQKIEKTRFALHELVDEVVRETCLIDKTHQLSVTSNAPVMIEADRGLLKQALRIFMDNSLKYTPAGGKVYLGTFPQGAQVKICLKDTGIGISREDLPYVFNRFYKCDKSRTREMGGTGLGLSIAKWIVEKHLGEIELQSTLNEGTTVIITLPASG